MDEEILAQAKKQAQKYEISKIAEKIYPYFGPANMDQFAIALTILSGYKLDKISIYIMRNAYQKIIKDDKITIGQRLIDALKQEIPEIMGAYMTPEEWSEYLFENASEK